MRVHCNTLCGDEEFSMFLVLSSCDEVLLLFIVGYISPLAGCLFAAILHYVISFVEFCFFDNKLCFFNRIYSTRDSKIYEEKLYICHIYINMNIYAIINMF